MSLWNATLCIAFPGTSSIEVTELLLEQSLNLNETEEQLDSLPFFL